MAVHYSFFMAHDPPWTALRVVAYPNALALTCTTVSALCMPLPSLDPPSAWFYLGT